MASGKHWRVDMNIFDVLREKFKQKKKILVDLSNEYRNNDKRLSTGYANKALAMGDGIEIVNQVEQFYNDTLKLNIDHKKLSADELVEHLQLHMELITFNPSTGEELKPCQMNELNRDLYTTMYHAKEFLESIPKPISPDKAEYAHEASYIQGWNECLEKIMEK